MFHLISETDHIIAALEHFISNLVPFFRGHFCHVWKGKKEKEMLLVPAAYETLMKVFLIKFLWKEIEENWKLAIYLRISRAKDLLNPIEKDFNFQCDSSTSWELNEGNYSLFVELDFLHPWNWIELNLIRRKITMRKIELVSSSPSEWSENIGKCLFADFLFLLRI